MECEVVVAIQVPMLNVLKKILNERYVPHLPPLLGDADPGNREKKQTSRAFSAFVLQTRFGIDAITASRAVIDDYNDNGVDAIFYNESDKTLYFVQSKLKATEQFQLGEAQAFLSGVKQIINKQFDTFNQNVRNIEGEIEAALDECDEIKLIIAFTGDSVSLQAKNEIRRLIQAERDDGDEQLQQDLIEFSAVEVEEALRQEQSSKLINEKLKIQKYRNIESPKKTVFGVVKLMDLVKLHEKHGKCLYEKNIRYFLGVGTRGVNSAIKKTLLNEPDKFLYLNNGITIVGSIKQRAKSRDNNTTREFEVLGMSVVNGAQTISTAAQFIQENEGVDISTALVLVTVISASYTDNFHKQVTKSRNLQNPVDLSNFAALDDNQERLRREIALYGVEYHYRPQRQLSAGIPIVEIETLAKALACLSRDITIPARLKSEPKQFTNTESEYYKKLFNDSLTGSKAINAVAVYKAIHTLLDAADKSSLSPEKLVYRHCNYALTSILIKQLKDKIEGGAILTGEQISRLISGPFDELRQKFWDQYQVDGIGHAHHAFFKRITDVARLTKKVLIAYQNMNEDQTVKNLQGRLVMQDPYNQALVNYLSGKAVQI